MSPQVVPEDQVELREKKAVGPGRGLGSPSAPRVEARAALPRGRGAEGKGEGPGAAGRCEVTVPAPGRSPRAECRARGRSDGARGRRGRGAGRRRGGGAGAGSPGAREPLAQRRPCTPSAAAAPQPTRGRNFSGSCAPSRARSLRRPSAAASLRLGRGLRSAPAPPAELGVPGPGQGALPAPRERGPRGPGPPGRAPRTPGGGPSIAGGPTVRREPRSGARPAADAESGAAARAARALRGAAPAPRPRPRPAAERSRRGAREPQPGQVSALPARPPALPAGVPWALGSRRGEGRGCARLGAPGAGRGRRCRPRAAVGCPRRGRRAGGVLALPRQLGRSVPAGGGEGVAWERPPAACAGTARLSGKREPLGAPRCLFRARRAGGSPLPGVRPASASLGRALQAQAFPLPERA